jgi:RNA polymerase sigma-70 factor (ECF subfamily)
MAEIRQRHGDVTQLLKQWRQGHSEALDGLLPLIYGELRRMARGQLAREHRRHTLQPTELVHEAFVKLVDQKAEWQSRVHFYGIAARCMRRILVDHARRKQAWKRPQAAGAVDLDTDIVSASSPIDTILAVDEALTRLAAIDPRHATIAELKFFGGLEVPEIAEIVGMSPATVKRDWAAAKQTLQVLLNGSPR